MPAIDFNNFHEELMRTTQGGGAIIQESIMYGAETLGRDFTVVQSRDKTPLLSLSVKDGWKPASDNFTGQNVLSAKSRIVSFREGDIDIEFTLSDIKKAYQTYLGWLKTPGLSLNEVNQTPFELFFLRYIVGKHFEFLRLKTAWRGVYNAAGSGAASLTDGFLTKFIAESQVGGDIASSHIFDGTALTDANAYAQFNGVAELLASTDENLLHQELGVYCSRVAYDKYRRNRQTKFPNHVGPADRPDTLDDYSNMKFVIDPGLNGSDAITITPPQNLLFVCNEDPTVFTINVVKAIKSYQITIRASLDFDFATGDWIFRNDL